MSDASQGVALLVRWMRTSSSTAERTLVTSATPLIERHVGIAYHLAGRYRHRGVSNEDLEQVAMIGLLKAVERFDPEQEARSAHSHPDHPR